MCGLPFSNDCICSAPVPRDQRHNVNLALVLITTLLLRTISAGACEGAGKEAGLRTSPFRPHSPSFGMFTHSSVPKQELSKELAASRDRDLAQTRQIVKQDSQIARLKRELEATTQRHQVPDESCCRLISETFLV